MSNGGKRFTFDNTTYGNINKPRYRDLNKGRNPDSDEEPDLPSPFTSAPAATTYTTAATPAPSSSSPLVGAPSPSSSRRLPAEKQPAVSSSPAPEVAPAALTPRRGGRAIIPVNYNLPEASRRSLRANQAASTMPSSSSRNNQETVEDPNERYRTLRNYHPRPVRQLHPLNIDYGDAGVPQGSVFDTAVLHGSRTVWYINPNAAGILGERGLIQNLVQAERDYVAARPDGEDIETTLTDLDNYRSYMRGEAINQPVQERLTDIELHNRQEPVMDSDRWVDWVQQKRELLTGDEGEEEGQNVNK
ncbi:hypothetical protein EJ08DRAFT_692555 [Tothia fuscella]|uniref:Uncharacterized protein n=1 Tax=Tothia fuscella TaxID=1048955 RepID=A0A9P4P1W0_9PEZI|nr:hypothetical protein EJ08DRAFT_692555 [Tothia fuscella]